MKENYFGILFDIERRCTNNIVINISGDNEVAHVTSPFTISDDELKTFLFANAHTIKNTRKRLDKNAYEYLDYFSEDTLEIFGEYFFCETIASGEANSFIISKDTHKVQFNVKRSDDIYHNVDYIKRKYCEFLKIEIEKPVNDLWDVLERKTIQHEFSWNIDKWVTYNNSKNTIYINPQITKKPINYLKFALLDEILRTSSTTESAYKYYMDLCVHGWKTIKDWCNSHKPKSFIRKKTKEKIALLNESDFKNIINCISAIRSDYQVSIQSITNLYVKNFGADKPLDISFDAIVFCEHESYPAMCYRIPCDKNGIEFAPGKPIAYCPPVDTGALNFPEELVPSISEADYIEQSEAILKRYSPSSLDDIDPVPIRSIVENEGLAIVEYEGLAEKLNVPFIMVLEDCDITDTESNVIINNARRGEIYIEKSAVREDANSHIARAYSYWQLHRNLFCYMFASGSKNIKENRCIFAPIESSEVKKPELMSARERIDEQATRMSMMTMVPSSSLDEMLKPIIKELENKKTGCISLEALVSLLSKHYKESELIIRKRLLEKRLNIREKQDIEDTLYSAIVDEVKVSEKKSTDMQSMNDSFSATLEKLIKIKRESIKKTKAKDKKPVVLAEASGISPHTLSRMRNQNGAGISLQMILGVCCGLNLSPPETTMLIDKSPYRLQPSNPEHYAYMSVMPLFKKYKIEEINDVLSDAGIKTIGGKSAAE